MANENKGETLIDMTMECLFVLVLHVLIVCPDNEYSIVAKLILSFHNASYPLNCLCTVYAPQWPKANLSSASASSRGNQVYV